MKLKTYCLALFMCVFTGLYAQEIEGSLKYCGSDEMRDQLFHTFPGRQQKIIRSHQELEAFTQQYISSNSAQRSGNSTVYVIPIVFHVIHNYGVENITDA